MKNGLMSILNERIEQLNKHGRTIANDVIENGKNQLSFAGSVLCCPDPEMMNFGHPIGWDLDWWTKTIKRPYRERLAIAGALIAAEIDRLNNIESIDIEEISGFLIMHEMSVQNQNIRMSPHFVGAQKTKQGGTITMGVDQKCIMDIATRAGEFGLALYIIEMNDYNKIKNRH